MQSGLMQGGVATAVTLPQCCIQPAASRLVGCDMFNVQGASGWRNCTSDTSTGCETIKGSHETLHPLSYARQK